MLRSHCIFTYPEDCHIGMDSVGTKDEVRDCVIESKKGNHVPIIAFICGMSRSGTTWLKRCLDNHPSIAAFGETGFWGKHYISGVDEYTPEQAEQVLSKMQGINCRSMEAKGVNPGAIPKYIKQEIVENRYSCKPAHIFNWMCRSLSRFTNKKFIVEKTPHHINWVGRINEKYRKVKFILMFRNAYEFMLSYKHQGDRMEKSVEKKFNELYHPLGCSYVYKKYTSSILRTAKEDKSLLVKLESVKNRPREVLVEVQKFLEVEVVEGVEIPRQNTSFPQDDPPELDNIDHFWMNLVAGSEMKKTGQRISQRSPSVRKILNSLLTIPVWFYRTAKHLSGYQMSSAWRYLSRWVSI